MTEVNDKTYERNSCEGCKYLSSDYSVEGELVEYCAKIEDPICIKYNQWKAKKEGLKFDKGKVKWKDAPWYGFQSVVNIMQYGADKYDVNNWKGVDIGRYQDALERHWVGYTKGEDCDQESKMHHLKHLACNAIFMIELDCKKKAYVKRCLPMSEELLEKLIEFDDRWLDAKIVYDDDKNLIGVQL